MGDWLCFFTFFSSEILRQKAALLEEENRYRGIQNL